MRQVRVGSAPFGWLMTVLLPATGLATSQSAQPRIEVYLSANCAAVLVIPDPKALATQLLPCPLGALFAATDLPTSAPASAGPSPAPATAPHPWAGAPRGGNLMIRSCGPASLVPTAGMAALLHGYAPPDDGASSSAGDGTGTRPESRPTAPALTGDAQ